MAVFYKYCQIFKYFFEGQFPLKMWNHFDNSYERTNNRVEGDNNKMKLFCGAVNPNIDEAVRLLQQFDAKSSDKYRNAKKSTARPPYKAPDQQKRDANFKQLKVLLIDGSISLKVYIDRIVDLYKFEPKKKYVEDLEDTDDSDATEDEDDESEEDPIPIASSDEEMDTASQASTSQFITCRPLPLIGTQATTSSEVNDGKIACDECGKRYTKRGMNIHKAVQK